jgi:hypothetical protein
MALTHLQAGDRAATLDARQKAVDLYRVLHAKQADIFEGNLARELLSLSRDLAGCGQIEEAYAASEESRRLYMHIIGTSPGHDHDHIHEYKTTGSCKRMHDSSKGKGRTGDYPTENGAKVALLQWDFRYIY